MLITKTRFIVRTALVVLIIAATGIGYRFYQIRQPAYHWQRAQAALAAGDEAKAEVELRGCLARLPNHALAHFRLAELLVRRAQQTNVAAGFARVPEAMQHLRRAAELAPDERAIQQALLTALVDANRLDDAEGVAQHVLQLDASHSAARVLLARQALRRRDYAAAASRLHALQDRPDSLFYTSWWLDFELGRTTNRPERQAAALTAVMQHAALSGKLPQSAAESGAFAALLLLGIDNVADATAAQSHAEAALALAPAPLAGQLGSSLDRRFPTSALTAQQRAAREPFTSKVAAICRQQTGAEGGGPPSAYQFLAEQAVASGDETAALKLLESGLAAADAAHLVPQEKLGLHLLAANLLLTAGRYDDIAQHVEPLLAEPATAGAGQMISGSIALAQGRFEDARRHFEQAAQLAGPALQIQLALATTNLALGQSAAALPYLMETVPQLDQLRPAEKAWLARYVGDGLTLKQALYQALLTADRADEAAPYLTALRGTAQEPPAQIALANWHWRHNRAPRAEAILIAAREERPDHIGLTLAHAALLAERGSFEDADALVGTFAAMKPEDLSRQLALLQWRVWRGQTKAALEALPELRQQFGSLPLIGSIEAQLLLAANRPQEALAAAETLRSEKQGQAAGSLLAAAAALRLGKTDAAAAMLDAAGAGPLVDLSRAQLLAATGKEGAALDILVSALRYSGAAPQAGVQIGSALDALAQRQGVRAALDKAGQLLTQQPDQPSLLAAHANLALAAGQPDVALEDLKRLEQKIPGAPVVAYLRAQALAAGGDAGAAAAELETVLAKDAKNIRARIFAAELAKRQGKLPVALKHAEAALRLDPSRLEAAALTADVLIALRRNDEAVAVLARLAQAAPHSPQTHIQLARCYEATGRVNEALATLAAAGEHLPRDFDVLAAHVSTLARNGQADAAVELARRSAAAHPDAFDAEKLGWLLLRLNQYAAARTLADQFLATAGPREAEAHWLLGNIDLLEGNRQHDLLKLSEAETHFRRVLEKHPGHLGATNNLAWILATSLNQPQQALKLVQKLLASPELKNVAPESLPPSVIDTLAVVLQKAGRADDARTLLTRAVRQHPQSANLQFQFGLSQLASQNYAEAETALNTALRLGLEGPNADRARQELNSLH